MIEFIKGKIEYFEESYFVIECGGMGYRINAGAGTISRLASQSGEVKVYTYMSVSDNGISLVGFEKQQQLKLFYKLINVSGIGPKVAMNILESMDVNKLVTAIATGDIITLSKAPGLGKKTAQRLVLELKDKLTTEEITQTFGTSEITEIVNVAESGAKTDAVEALESLGYSRSEALKAVGSVYKEGDSVEKLIKAALRKMI
ncbi:MAG: Holliday junction branch migration protein RuvA [Firmicutes bacterium]|nr:Holliday junction branch migration protein RuvA [Bacillota bacterium]